MAAPTIHMSPDVNLKFINSSVLPLLIIVKTPNKQTIKPIILDNVTLSLNKKTDKNTMNIGDEV